MVSKLSIFAKFRGYSDFTEMPGAASGDLCMYPRSAGIVKFLRISSRLVGESLVNFQCKVAQIVEPIGFTFDDFYFVVDPFKLSVVNGVVTVV